MGCVYLSLKSKNKIEKKKTVIVVGPGPNNIGGMPEYIKGLVNSKVNTYYNFKLFDTLKAKKRKNVGKSIISIRELLNSLNVFNNYISLLKVSPNSIIHIHTSSYWGFFEKLVLAEIGKFKGNKIIFHIHGGNFVNFFNRLKFKKKYLKLMERYNAVVVLTEEMKKVISTNNVIVISNAVKIPDVKLESINNNPFTFVSISVLEKRKRVMNMLKAASVLKNKGRDFRLIIAGDGPQREEIKEFIKMKEIGDVVSYVGVVKDEAKDLLLKKSDVFILASASDSFGIVIIEAMSYGKGIITTPVGISPKIVKDKENGLVVNIDSEEDLINAMDSFIKKDILNIEMKHKNQLVVKENYSWNFVAEKIIEIYSEC